MKKQKILALLLACTMMFALAACASGTDTDEPEGTTAAGTETADAGDETANTPITLTAWCWDKNVDALEEAARLYTELTGIQIDLTVEAIASGDCETAMTTACESGDDSALPDIMLMQDTSVYKFATTYPDLLYDLTSYVDWELSSTAKTSLTSVGDVHYGVPFDSGSSIAMYRPDVLEQAGYTVEDLTDISWDELIDIGANVYDSTGYYLLTDTGMCILHQMITSSGVAIFNEDGSAKLTDNEAVTAAMEAYQEAVERNVIYVSSDWNDYIASLTGGTVACGVIQGCWIANNINTNPNQANLWEVTNIPNLSSVSTSTHYTNQGGSSWVVLNKSENTDAAAAFLGYIFAGEGMESYQEFLTKDIGYVTTYQPVIDSGYYDTVEDGFYNAGFWGTVAETAANAPVFNTSVMYGSTMTALATAIQEVIAGSDVATAVANAQSTLDFEFNS